MSSCTVSAKVTTNVHLNSLAVVAVKDGEREVLRAVVPVDRGRSWRRWRWWAEPLGRFRRDDVTVPSLTPRLDVKYVGFVVVPEGVRIAVTEVATTCGGSPVACRTVGRVKASDGGSWLVVVEVRHGRGERQWELVRLANGRGTFASEWQQEAPDGRSRSKPEVVAMGIVGSSPDP